MIGHQKARRNLRLRCGFSSVAALLFFMGLGSVHGALPEILMQPQSRTNLAGSVAVFTVVADEAATLNYQWQRSGMDLANTARVSGVTSNTLTISDVKSGDAGEYSLWVSNVDGGVSSDAVSLIVTGPDVVIVADQNLEAAIRSSIEKPFGPLTPSDLARLTALSVCTGGVADLFGLEWATNLTSLCLSHNSITSLAALQGLNNLIQLSLDDNQINDLSPLVGLSGLISLNAGDNLITNYSALSSLTNLTSLWLYGNTPRSLSVLTNLNRLASLTLYSSRLADIAPLGGLYNLNYLDLRFNPLTNAEVVLTSLTNLATLYLGSTGVRDVSFLRDLPSLKFLNLDHNKISDLSPLTNCPSLRGLDGAYNPLTNVTQIGALTNLTSLYLSGHSISNLAVFQNLSNLTSLTLYSNAIENLLPLSGLEYLQELGLGWNPITNTEILVAFTNLTSLWLDGNSLSNVGFVQGLSRLTALGLRHNRLRNLGELGGLTNLIALHADYNRLTDIKALEALPFLASVGLGVNLLDVTLGSSVMNSIQSLRSRGVNVTWLPQNQPPGILVITNWIVAANATSSLRTFSVFDDFTRQDQLLVSATSSNTELIPDQLIALGSFGGLRTLTITPASNQVGTLMLNLAVMDMAGSVTDAGILVTVQHATNIAIPDPKLEATLRQSLGKPSGDLNSVDFLGLTNLYLSSPLITSLSGLEWAENLTGLSLRRAAVTNLDVLQKLPNLNSLILYDIPLLNYSPLAGLTNLTTLYLTGNSIGDLTFLAHLTQLTDLILAGSRLTDISLLASLTNLVSVDLYQNRLTDGSPLTNLLNLRFVDLRVNLMETDTNSVLDHILAQGIEVLYLPQNQPPAVAISNPWIIATNTTSSLRFFVSDDVSRADQLQLGASSSNPDLIGNTDIYLAGTNNYRTLTVTPSSSQTGTVSLTLTLTDDTGLQSEVDLQVMVVVPRLVVIADSILEAALRLALGKPAGDIYDVDFQLVTELHLDNPKIASLSGLEWATNLTKLHLNATGITNLDWLQNLSHLTSLSLANSRLTDIYPLIALTNLVFLDLHQNRLTEISRLTNLLNLSTVDLRLNLLETSANAVLEQLRNQGLSVWYQPQRAPPTLATATSWFVAANTTSVIHFSAWSDGPPEEPLVITSRSSTGSLMPNTNLVVTRDILGLAHDWILTVTPPSNYTGNSSITLLATNEVGMSATVTVDLTVALPLPLNDLVLEEANLIWLTGGGAPWFGQTNRSHAGGSAAQSGNILDLQESWLAASVPGPGLLSFWWKVSSEAESDWLEFHLDDQLQARRISGESDWELVTFSIPRGEHTIKWRYHKDPGWTGGLDAAWLDQVSFVPLSWLELSELPASGQCQLFLHLILGQQYILETSTNLVDWFPLTVVAATNTTIPFLDMSANSSVRFYRLKELFASAIWLQNPNRIGNEFQIELHSPPGLRFEMQGSTDLISWSGLLVITNTLGTTHYTDSLATNSPMRFYRARLLP